MKRFLKQNHSVSGGKKGGTTIHPGIFLGWALWADSVSTQMNTITSHDQTNKNLRTFSGEL